MVYLTPFFGFALAVALTVRASSSADALPTVDLGYAVHQATLNASGAYSYYNFSNIRFAEAPVGELRFAAPVPPVTINRTVNDGQQSYICPQANPAWSGISLEYLSGFNISTLQSQSNFNFSSIPSPVTGTSEDCLFLDVIVPRSIFSAGRTKVGAPVIVWIYGGGYTIGSKFNGLDPATLLARAKDNDGEGVIYVAFNYRLGLFGWLSGPSFQINGTANVGLYDQELALKWIQKNIALFGGDPNRVTVIGESAGGGSILHQITAYGGLKGKVPFQQAILQSPGFQPLPGSPQQEAIFQKTLKYASLISGKNVTTVQDLRTLTQLQLYYINYILVAISTFGDYTYGPAVDGIFVPKLPGELLLHGQFDRSLRIMVGHNANEGAFFTDPFIVNNTDFNAYVQRTFPAATPATLAYVTETLYPPVFDGSYGYTSQYTRLDLLVSEVIFTCNTRYLDLAFNNLTYAYYVAVPPGLHGVDIAYTFFNGDTHTSNRTLNLGYPINPTVATVFQRYLTRFASTGSPNAPSLPFFPAYGLNASTQLINITALGTQVVDTAADPRCDWWQRALYY